MGCRNIRQPIFFEQIGPVRGHNYVKGLTEVSSHNPERLQTAGNPAKGENMAVKPSSYGADRLFARLDLENSDYYPEVTMQQKAAMKVKYFRTRTAQNYYLTQTKQVLAKLKELDLRDVLIVTDDLDENLMLATQNVYGVDVCGSQDINPVALVGFEKILVTTGALKELEERLA